MKTAVALFVGALVYVHPAGAAAQDLAGATSSPVWTATWLALLGLLPFVLVVTTSFTKIAVVLSVLRSALGTQNVPPNVVLAALAVMLTGYVMAPVFSEMAAATEGVMESAGGSELSAAQWIGHAGELAEPLRRFLDANAGDAERALFLRLRNIEVEPGDPTPLIVAVPAFAITELSEAFQIGFLLFLPFLVLDLLIGSLLLSLGMHMLSPTSVSMPFKLLLFILVNGWIVLSESLVLGYTYGGGP
jgi:type III secretion protein R